MRSLAVILLAAAGFGAFLYVNHHRANALVASEAAALEQFRAYARAPEGTPLDAVGYHFHWETEGSLPPLAVAGPLQPFESGVRWFASLPGAEEADLYEFDTVLSRASGGVPDFNALRGYLSLPAAERTSERRPFGWRIVTQK